MASATVAAGFPKAFLDFAVTRGAGHKELLERSHISPADLQDQDNRIPLASYVTLMKAAIELCHEPALALIFGEAVRMHDISIVGLIGEVAESAESGRQQINRYARLLIDDGADADLDRVVFVRENGTFWIAPKRNRCCAAEGRIVDR